jgi:hypothetical protein
LAAPVIYFERSRDELGLVRWNRPQNGSTSRAGEKRTLHGAAKPKEIERQFPGGRFCLGHFCGDARAPQYSCRVSARHRGGGRASTEKADDAPIRAWWDRFDRAAPHRQPSYFRVTVS